MEFAGTRRFGVVRRLGSGGMGSVYEVMDHERGAAVALKTLNKLTGPALYRFKNEFRSLVEVSHGNLVRLFELFSEGTEWFFTMELVRGRSLGAYVRDERDEYLLSDPPPDPLGSTVDGALPAERPRRSTSPPVLRTPSQEEIRRLRGTLAQLVDGVAYLHDMGKIHRDIKPSNVVVAHDGRAVLLDFGVVVDVRKQNQTDAGAVLGTPEYMAPEQAAGGLVTPAADWYAVGSVLYEALTGRLPFVGTGMQILIDKQSFEPHHPRELGDVPEDLADLCVALLRRKPDARPSGAEVLRRLGVSTKVEGRRTYETASTSFVGRGAALRTLSDGLERARGGQAEMVLVRGVSGMGKSALVQHFLDTVVSGGSAVVLSGRCYERESVPYKAFDSVVDALSRFLRKLSRATADALMPLDPLVLACVFPVLERIPSVAEAQQRTSSQLDPQRLRVRAFAALRELFQRLAVRQPLVLFIDDLQWSDADSLVLLAELTAPPDPPPMLTILGFRAEDEERSEALITLRRVLGTTPRERSPREVAVEALTEPECVELAASLLRASDRQDPVVVQIARECRGSPLFLGELVRHAETHGASTTTMQLETVLRARILELSPHARLLPEVVAVTGRPVRRELAAAAADHLVGQGPAVDWDQALSMLRVGHFVRSLRGAQATTLEVFHDRIRETVTALLGEPHLRAIHTAIATALRDAPDADPEMLLVHHRAAGMTERAIELAEVAAQKASRALAFDRAAELFEAGLSLMDPSDRRAQGLRVDVARALLNAGRGFDAAQAFLEAAKGASKADEIELRRQAAEQLLTSGHIGDGLRALDEVLRHSGMRLARSPLEAIVRLVALRLWGALLLAIGVRTRDRSEIAEASIRRLDVCWSTLLGLGIVDNVRAAEYSARHLTLALRTGDLFRACRGIITESFFVCAQGVASKARAMRLLDRATPLLARVDDPYLKAIYEMAQAWRRYFCGEFAQAWESFERTQALFEEHGIGARWERDNVIYFGLCTAYFRGDLRTVMRRLPSCLREANDRGDLYLETLLRIGETTHHWLAFDDVAGAREAIDEIMARWPSDRFLVQHMYAVRSRALIDLYEGGGEESVRRMAESWGPMRRGMHLRVELSFVRVQHLRACASLAAAEGSRDRGPLVAAARRDGAALVRRRPVWARGLGHLVLAGASALEGREDAARRALQQAQSLLDAVGMALFAAGARARLGALIGGDEGAALRDGAMAAIAAQGVKRPERFLRTLAPGFEEPSRPRR